MESSVSHSVRVVLLLLGKRGDLPYILMVHQKERRGPARKQGKPFIRKEGWGIPGGSKGEEDFDLIDTAVREARSEAGVVLPREVFLEEYAIHLPPVESDRRGCGYLEAHYYLGILSETMPMVPIAETDEVLGIRFFRLDDFPLPNDRLGSYPSHIKKLHDLLLHLCGKMESAYEWLSAFEKRTAEWL